jgi:PPE-repeat protein
MTSYFVSSAQTAGFAIAVRAVTYELRIAQIDLVGYTGGGFTVLAFRHENSTLSGGTSIGVAPLHQGAPAASATAMVGSSLAFSGTSKLVGSAYLPPANSSAIDGTSVITTYSGSSAQIVSPLTLTIAPGSVLHVAGAFNVNTGFCDIYFEELRLAGSY